MRHLLLTICALLTISSLCSAQNIRLGERLPDINVTSELGMQLDLITQKYVCLVFVHSESLPCITALEEFQGLCATYGDRMATVLITAEQRSDEQEVMSRFVNKNTSLVFDDNRRTFNAFGINYVPFGVIYETKRRKAVWFGSLRQLHAKELESILK